MGDCDLGWQPVFLTRGDDLPQGELEMDDYWVAPVMSVQVQHQPGSDKTHIDAVPVTSDGSDWLMLAFPMDYNAGPSDSFASKQHLELERWLQLKVGDMIRVGTASTGGFTDYMTILETVDVTRLTNVSAEEWQVRSYDKFRTTNTVLMEGNTENSYTSKSGDKKYPEANTGKNGSDRITHLAVAGDNKGWLVVDDAGGAPTGTFRAVRVNFAINAGHIDADYRIDSKFTGAQATAANKVTVATRGEITTFFPREGRNYHTGKRDRECLFYPCYRQRPYSGFSSKDGQSALRIKMPTNIKTISGVQLVGYSLVHKRSVALQQTHEMYEDDWFALRIRELNPDRQVLSNNAFANQALHVIHAGNSIQKAAGSVELHDYDTHGLATTRFRPINLPSITVEVVDRYGQPAHLGRMHVWLKVFVASG